MSELLDYVDSSEVRPSSLDDLIKVDYDDDDDFDNVK